MNKKTATIIALIASFIAIAASIYLNGEKPSKEEVHPGTVTYLTSQNVDGTVFALIMEANNSPLNEIAKTLSEVYKVDIFLEPTISSEPVKTKLGATSLDLLLEQLLPPLDLTFYKIYDDIFIIPEDIADNLSSMEVKMPKTELNETIQAKIVELAPESEISVNGNNIAIKCSPMHFNAIQEMITE